VENVRLYIIPVTIANPLLIAFIMSVLMEFVKASPKVKFVYLTISVNLDSIANFSNVNLPWPQELLALLL